MEFLGVTGVEDKL